jgi:hypothetical protein
VRKRGGKAEFARGVCDSIKDGVPDLYNSVAKRVVPLDEATKHGWAHYYDGATMCPQGHIAARYVSNHFRCVDCARIADGKPAIYGVSQHVDELTGTPVYVDPLASDKFEWTAEKERQFLHSWANSGGDFLKACAVIGAQPMDVITRKRTNPEFDAAYADARLNVDEVQLLSMEGRAGSSDRIALAQASSKFTQFGAKTGLAGRPAINSEQARAGLAKLISDTRKSIAQRARLSAGAGNTGNLGRPDRPAADAAGATVAGPALLEPSHDHSDLVS